MQHAASFASASLLALVAVATPASAQCSLQKIYASDAAPTQLLGLGPIEIEGDLMVVGNRHNSTVAPNAGAVYVFRRQAGSWTEVQVLRDPAGQAGDGFGAAIALAGDQLMVSAPAANGQHGRVFVYDDQGGTYVFDSTLESSSTSPYQFGSAISVDGDHAVVIEGLRKTIHEFIRVDGCWTCNVNSYQVAEPLEDNGFGLNAVFWKSETYGNFHLVVTAEGDDDVGPDAGAIYSFRRPVDSGWQQLDKHYSETGKPSHRFGRQLVRTDDITVVVSGNHVDSGDGFVQVFVNELSDDWETTFADYDGPLLPAGQNYRFGEALANDGDRIAISAPHSGAFPNHQSRTYVSRLGEDEWEHQAVVSPFDEVFGQFKTHGTQLAMKGDTLVVGAAHDQDLGPSAGALYVHSISGVGCPDFLGAPPVISASAGGTQYQHMRGGSAVAGRIYFVLGSLTGTDPGVIVGTKVLPLTMDGYFALRLDEPNHPQLWPESVGVLDHNGAATARTISPDGLPASFVGTTFYHAWFSIAQQPPYHEHASSAISVKIVP